MRRLANLTGICHNQLSLTTVISDERMEEALANPFEFSPAGWMVAPIRARRGSMSRARGGASPEAPRTQDVLIDV
jgi:hypothetical protein